MDSVILNAASVHFLELCSCVFGFARNRKTTGTESKSPDLTTTHAIYMYYQYIACYRQHAVDSQNHVLCLDKTIKFSRIKSGSC
jgi:hypothetical protein